MKGGNDSIRKIIGVDVKAKYAPISFFDDKGTISPYLDAAYKAANNQFEKTLLRRTRK
jgi:hypothetical protein